MTPEGRVLRSCMDYLALCKVAAWRVNVSGVPLHDGSGGFRPAPSRGMADIIGIIPPQRIQDDERWPAIPLAVEVKSARGKQSPAQVEFHRKWEGAGGLYLLVRSAKELADELRAAGVTG